jgi:hypothetical protein
LSFLRSCLHGWSPSLILVAGGKVLVAGDADPVAKDADPAAGSRISSPNGGASAARLRWWRLLCGLLLGLPACAACLLAVEAAPARSRLLSN